MNQELWNKILAFDFDNPPSEYGFSTRLANENFWTKEFTGQAILEYKKFMYLAATSDFMVSPSEIVDTVWHQHLIFTQLYQNFGELLGKQVQHIPSTHNKEEAQKFRLAKERTKKFYTESFGEQPKGIWEFNDMYSSLNLDKAKIKLRTFIIIGILSFIALTVPVYYLLNPIYVNIENPDFLIGFGVLAVAAFAVLDYFNYKKLKQIIKLADKDSFIYHLQPFELVYLKRQKISHVINGTANELIENNTIQVNSNYTIELIKNGEAKTKEQLQVTAVLSEMGTSYYPVILRRLSIKPLFRNVANCMGALKKYFNKSKKFNHLFYLNFGILTLILMLGFIRLTTGILRDKPVTLVAIAVIILTVLIIVFLNRLTKMVCTHTIPDLYKNEILPTRQVTDNWQWSYFLLGTAVLTTSFIPIVNYSNKNNTGSDGGGDSGSSYGASDGSSCGSSCSSCGGCGGGGD